MSNTRDTNRTQEWVITIRFYTSEQMAQGMFDDIDLVPAPGETQ